MAHDEVDVALADPRLGVGKSRVLLRQRVQALAGDLEVDAKTLSSPRLDVMTSPVTPTWSPRSTSFFQRSSSCLATGIEGEHDLQVGRGVAQRREDDLAADAVEHDPAGDAGCLAGERVRLEVGEAGSERRGVGGPGVAECVRVVALGLHARQLLPAHLLLLGSGITAAGTSRRHHRRSIRSHARKATDPPEMGLRGGQRASTVR